MIEIIEIPKDTITDICTKYCVDERNEIYFIAHETELTKPISILFSNLDWIRKTFGVALYDVNSDVTHESLNKGRIKSIEIKKKAIELNVHPFDLENMTNQDGTFKTYRNPNYGKFVDFDGVLKRDLRKEVEETPRKLTKSHKVIVETDIAKGLYVICKYV